MRAQTKGKARPETKLQVIGRMIQRKNGASEGELTRATGWTPHSFTGAMSRLRKQGLAVAKVDDAKRGRVYRAERPSA